MTTIVYRDGILAADTRGYSGDAAPIGNKRKIFALKDGGILGVSTPLPGLSESIMQWMDDGGDPNEAPAVEPNFTALYISPADEVFYYNNNYSPSGPLSADYFAIGSGREYAYGALVMGASSVEAVQAAVEHDVFSGGDILTLTLSDAKSKKIGKSQKIGF